MLQNMVEIPEKHFKILYVFLTLQLRAKILFAAFSKVSFRVNEKLQYHAIFFFNPLYLAHNVPK